MGSTFARGGWNAEIASLSESNYLNINHLELLAIAIGVEVLGREQCIPTDGRRIVFRGDNLGARDIANKWAAEGPIMGCVLRILHNVCNTRQVRVWIIQISTKDNGTADRLSRSPHFKTSSPTLQNGREVSPPTELNNWLRDIINTAWSNTARAHRINTDLNCDDDRTLDDAHTNFGNKLAFE